MISIYDGDMDNGKSTVLAWLTYKILRRNIDWWEHRGKYGIKKLRRVYTTQKLAPWLFDEFGQILTFIDPQDTLEKAPDLHECDFMYDDMNMDLDAQHYQDTPRAFKGWLRQCGHTGTDIYGNTQDFITVDPTVRCLTKYVTNVRMIFGNDRPAQSKPQIKRMYGIIMLRPVPQDDFKKEKPDRRYRNFLFARYMKFDKFKASLFDTNQRMKPAKLPPYHCVERGCDNPNHTDAYQRPFRHFQHIK